MNVSLAEVLAGAQQHAVPLTAECVGYLVLGAADQVLGAPRSVGAEDLLLSEDGAVRVAGGRAARAEDAERDLRAVLDALLLRASSASAGLLRASRRPPGTGIEGLVRELETALIPVNRSAAKRSLSRLQRETRRALDSGRIRLDESVAPPRAPTPPSEAPHVEVAASREPTVAPPVVANVAVASPPVAVAPSPVAVALPDVAPSEPLPSVALPPVESELTVVTPRAETREHTMVLSQVAPREPQMTPVPQLVETRPEPVVQRASQRPVPSASAVVGAVAPEVVEAGHTVRLPPVAVSEPPAQPSAPTDTPVLGTRVQADAVVADAAVADAETGEASELDIDVIEVAAADAAPQALTVAPVSDDDDDLIEVVFEDDERTVFPEDHELVYAEPAALEASDTTDPCPPLAAESMLPPSCEAVTPRLPASVAVEAEASRIPPPVVAIDVAPEPPPNADAAPRDLVASEVELAELVESALPPWTTAEAPALDVTPPPRVALPEPRQSDVEDLLLRLTDAPLGVDELRSGLRRLAGLEPTPPPPGTLPSE